MPEIDDCAGRNSVDDAMRLLNYILKTTARC